MLYRSDSTARITEWRAGESDNCISNNLYQQNFYRHATYISRCVTMHILVCAVMFPAGSCFCHGWPSGLVTRVYQHYTMHNPHGNACMTTWCIFLWNWIPGQFPSALKICLACYHVSI